MVWHRDHKKGHSSAHRVEVAEAEHKTVVIIIFLIPRPIIITSASEDAELAEPLRTRRTLWRAPQHVKHELTCTDSEASTSPQHRLQLQPSPHTVCP